MTEQQLEKLVDMLNDKYEQTIHLKSKSSVIRNRFPVPLELDANKHYKVAVKYFAVYNSIKNIKKDENDTFRYSKDNGIQWKTITIPEGAYEIDQLQEEVKRLVTTSGEWSDPDPIVFGAHQPTVRATLTLTKNYSVDFANAKSFRNILGFKSQIYKAGYHRAENPADISAGVSTINIQCDFINDGYVADDNSNLTIKNILFSIPTFTVPVGSKIIEVPVSPEYLHLNRNTLTEINLNVVDEDENLIDFGNEEIVMKLHIIQI